MVKIYVTLVDDDEEVVFTASSIGPPKQYEWGFQIILKQPVKINDEPLPIGGKILYGAGTECRMEDGEILQGRMEFTVTKEKVTLNVYKAKGGKNYVKN